MFGLREMGKSVLAFLFFGENSIGMGSRYTVNYAQQVSRSLKVKKAKTDKGIPGVFLLIITMIALAVYVQFNLVQNQSADIRTKAYTQAPSGIRIEATEMTRSGSVSLDPSGTTIVFGP